MRRSLPMLEEAKRTDVPVPERRLFSLITLGFELPTLEMHMRLLESHVTKFLVTEATTTFHAVNEGRLAPNKHPLLTLALANASWPAHLASKTRVTVLHALEVKARCTKEWPGHSMSRPGGCYEAMHRFVLLEMLLATARDEDMALLGDVDEIASPDVLRHLTMCAPFSATSFTYYVLNAHQVYYGVHCWGPSTWVNGPHLFLTAQLRAERLSPKRLLGTRGQTYFQPNVIKAAWHFTSLGSAADFRRKLTSWGHADMFLEKDHPGSLDEARLERCMRYCLSPMGEGPQGKPAPPCNSRESALDKKLTGQLLTTRTIANGFYPSHILHRKERYSFLFQHLV